MLTIEMVTVSATLKISVKPLYLNEPSLDWLGVSWPRPRY
jgi:hypothetical protein